jgi:SAM-dependent methyltransferase
MDRATLSRIAHGNHPIAAPVSEPRARVLLSRLSPPPGGRVLDLGCGSGVWLAELLDARQDLTGVGVDVALPPDVAHGRTDRITWVEADAARYEADPVDTVLCIGASHAFGGLAPTLDAVRRHLRRGGQVLLGDALWERPPSAAAQRALEAGPDEFPDLPGLLAQARASGFEPGYGHVSTLEEWDDYEWSWTGALTEWALREAPTAADREEALEVARRHRDEWLEGYRGQLGFVFVVLNDVRE